MPGPSGLMVDPRLVLVTAKRWNENVDPVVDSESRDAVEAGRANAVNLVICVWV